MHDPDRVRELGVDPDRPSVIFVGRITRQKGLPLFLRAAAAAAARGAARAVRRRAGHPGDRGRGAAAWSTGLGRDRDGRGLDRARCCRGPTSSRCSPPPPSSPARRSTSRSASSTSRRWPARPPSSPPPPAASRRSSCDGETGWLVPIEQATDGTGTPLDPDRYVADLAAALIEAVERPRPRPRLRRGRDAAAPRSPSAGPRSPTRPSTSTARSCAHVDARTLKSVATVAAPPEPQPPSAGCVRASTSLWTEPTRAPAQVVHAARRGRSAT